MYKTPTHLEVVHTDPACWDCDRATTLMINSMTQLILDDGIHIWYGLQQTVVQI